MAVNFATQPTILNPQPYPYQQYNAAYPSQQPSPESSTGSTPSNNSPQSPRHALTAGPPHLAFQSRQLRPPKSPLYVPAVLRPTEPPPSRVSSPPKNASRLGAAPPLTPPSSAGNSFSHEPPNQRPPNDDDNVLRRILGDGPERSGHITRIVTDEWNDDSALEDVTGLPTKDHWKPDGASSSCNAPRCDQPFTFLNRRHHCRRCGNIFCGEHSANMVPLDQHARFHPDGALARACECCWGDFLMWDRARKLRKGSFGSATLMGGNASPGESSGTATPTGAAAKPCGRGESELEKSQKPKVEGKNAGETVFGSLNWSTF